MRFEHPELLYALFLLLIPIIVHLFRLRKFQKEDFTNVKFLKKVIQETRKSSRLKKFLILCTRLLLIGFLVLAFSQPYIPASTAALKEEKTLVYLDNSFSMQASGEQNSLFNNAVNSLIENINPDSEYSLLTNNQDFENLSAVDFKSKLQDLELVSNQINSREIYLKAERFFKNNENTNNQLVVISDFQKRFVNDSIFQSKDFGTNLIKLQSQNLSNLSIDSAFVTEENPENFQLNIKISGNTASENPVMISVYNGVNLLGRKSIAIVEGSNTANFKLQNEAMNDGMVKIEDVGLNYDDILYFSKREKSTIKVVAISESNADFLQKIYTEPEFDLKVFEPGQVDFNSLNQANLIVLNEVSNLSNSLINNITNTTKNGTSLIVIPPVEFQSGFTGFLNEIGFVIRAERSSSEKLITSIATDHPLLKDVFEDQIDNFEYPRVSSSFNISNGDQILKFQDGSPFLLKSGDSYLFASAINSENSNFKNSPLIVPVFYQIGLQSLRNHQLYFSVNKDEQIDIPIELAGDQVLHLTRNQQNIIPQQQNYSNKVEIYTTSNLLEAGNYEVIHNENTIGAISFNNSRQESELLYSDINSSGKLELFTSIEEYFTQSKASSQITALWKWFIIFAMIFLAIEMLLIKFLK